MRGAFLVVALACLCLGAMALACDPPGGGWGPALGDGATLSGTVTLDVTVQSETEVQGVDLYVDGALATSLTSAPYTYDLNTTEYENGTHELSGKIRALKRADGALSPVKVTVKN